MTRKLCVALMLSVSLFAVAIAPAAFCVTNYVLPPIFAKQSADGFFKSLVNEAVSGRLR